MSRKRRNSSSVEPDSPSSADVPIAPSRDVVDYASGNQRPQVDSSTGQTGAFPGLEDGDGELFYGPAIDGIDYLRMVRSERKGIPELLTTTAAAEDFAQQEDGCYFDGAYTAPPRPVTDASKRLDTAQEYYYESLLDQFQIVRVAMRRIPPLEAIQTLDSSRLISFPPESKQARGMWEEQIRGRDPHPVQLACMDCDSTLQLAQLISRKMFVLFRSDDSDHIDHLGAWLWAILGKCPDRGDLGSEEISFLRDLARKAAEVLAWLDDKQQNDSTGQDESDQERQADEVDESTLQHLVQPQTSTTDLEDSNGVRRKKAIILDAVITIVGEVYGQRDLLDLRKAWLV